MVRPSRVAFLVCTKSVSFSLFNSQETRVNFVPSRPRRGQVPALLLLSSRYNLVTIATRFALKPIDLSLQPTYGETIQIIGLPGPAPPVAPSAAAAGALEARLPPYATFFTPRTIFLSHGTRGRNASPGTKDRF